MPTKFLVPKPGLTVRDPKSLEPLPVEGREVEMTTFWKRRFNDGDVTEGKPVKTAKATKE